MKSSRRKTGSIGASTIGEVLQRPDYEDEIVLYDSGPLHRKPDGPPIVEGSWVRARAPLHQWAGEVGKCRVSAGGEHAR
jgi:hypothetical protein